MTDISLFNTFALPIFFGLLGFIEPCSIGSTLLVLKQIEGQPARAKIVQTAAFAATRAVFIGLLGTVAAVLGGVFFGLQKAAWLLLGVLYVALGVLYLSGRAGLLMRSFGPSRTRLRTVRGALALGVLFGLNIPACAAPLILALLGSAAVAGTARASLIGGFVSLGLFGFALSLPLVLAVFFAPARKMLDALAALSTRLPRWTGVLLLALGLWSVWFALFVSIQP